MCKKKSRLNLVINISVSLVHLLQINFEHFSFGIDITNISKASFLITL